MRSDFLGLILLYRCQFGKKARPNYLYDHKHSFSFIISREIGKIFQFFLAFSHLFVQMCGSLSIERSVTSSRSTTILKYKRKKTLSKTRDKYQNFMRTRTIYVNKVMSVLLGLEIERSRHRRCWIDNNRIYETES